MYLFELLYIIQLLFLTDSSRLLRATRVLPRGLRSLGRKTCVVRNIKLKDAYVQGRRLLEWGHG